MIHSSQATTPDDALTTRQIGSVSMMWGTYAAFYLGRLNLSPALPEIAGSLKIGLGEVGILGNVFFWSYAAGQVINGQLGSILRPHRVVLAGLLLAAAANIGFALQSSLVMMALFWGVNGFAQSMGWGPMLRILSAHISTDQKRHISTVFSMSFQVGTSIAWGLAALLITLGDFRLAFLIPGILLLFVAVFWRIAGLDGESEFDERETIIWQKFSVKVIFDDMRRLFPMLIVAACIGFVYVGFLIWLPTFIQEWDFLPDGMSKGLTAFVPLVGILGMLLSGQLLSRQSNLFKTLIQMMLGLFVCLWISATTSAFVQMTSVLGAVMLASGLAGLLLSAAPMLLVEQQRVSSAGGLLTAIWSIAGGMAGTFIGTLVESSGWTAVFNLWMTCTFAAFFVVLTAWTHHQRSLGREKDG